MPAFGLPKKLREIARALGRATPGATNALVVLALFALVELGDDAGDALADDVFDERPQRLFVFGLGHQSERYSEAAHVGAAAAVRAALAVVPESVLHERRRID